MVSNLCILVTKIIPKGLFRLLFFLPMICFFLYLPLKINSVHLCGNTAFFISWLCNFKLLLLAFDQGPLSDSSLSITKFLILACLPIKIQQNFQEKSEFYVQNGVNRGKLHQNGHFRKTPSTKSAEKVSGVETRNDFEKNAHFQEIPSTNSAEKVSSVQTRKDFDKDGHFQETPALNSAARTENKPFQDSQFHETPSQKSPENSTQNKKYSHRNGYLQERPFRSSRKSKSVLNYGIKALPLALIIRLYDYSDYIHPYIILVIYCFHIYLYLEIILAIVRAWPVGFSGLSSNHSSMNHIYQHHFKIFGAGVGISLSLVFFAPLYTIQL